MQKCPDCAAENSDEAQKCVSCRAALAASGSRHQSFARRLSELQDAMVSAELPVSGRKTEERRPVLPASPARAPRPAERPILPARREELMDQALSELERQAKHAFLVYLSLSGTLLTLMVVSGIIFLASLVTGANWPVIVATAASGGFALLCLVGLQLMFLGRRQQRIAILIAELEAARRALEHHFDVWDEFLNPRMGTLTPEEMSVAVDALARGCQTIIGDLASLREPAAGRAPAQSGARDNGVANPAVAAKY